MIPFAQARWSRNPLIPLEVTSALVAIASVVLALVVLGKVEPAALQWLDGSPARRVALVAPTLVLFKLVLVALRRRAAGGPLHVRVGECGLSVGDHAIPYAELRRVDYGNREQPDAGSPEVPRDAVLTIESWHATLRLWSPGQEVGDFDAVMDELARRCPDALVVSLAFQDRPRRPSVA